MKNIPTVIDALENEHAVHVIPEVVIDWNMNRYTGAVANNNPDEESEGYDVEMFPIESIIQPIRPTKGINKARVGMGTISPDYRAEVDTNRNGRFYLADVDDSYKYWTSPTVSDTSGNITKTKPQVIYNANVKTNKIVITTENSWATAKTFSVQVTTNANPTDSTSAGNWTEIANQTTLGNSWKASGQITLYWNGTSWVTSGRVDNADKSPRTTTIRGVRIVVTALEGGYKISPSNSLVPSTYKAPNSAGLYVTQNTSGKQSAFDLIEISARLEVDLSPYVVSVNDEFDFSDVSSLYPIGTVTTNMGTITLSNLYEDDGTWVPGLFNKYNADSPFSNLLEPNAEVICKYKYFDNDGDFLATVQAFKMYTEAWTGQSEDNVSLEVKDFSKFFDSAETKLRASMWENLTVSEIVWRLLDSIGFVDYEIDLDDDVASDHVIPVFYTDGEKTAWEVLDELAQASQSAIYFDSFGKLQVKTRDFAFSSNNSAVWEFTSETSSERLANIVTLDVETEFEPNHFKVVYQKTNWSPENNGQPTMQKVWEPDGTVTLRANPLLRTLETNATHFWISSSDVRYWPYEGMVNIGGELIKFKGKHFVYYTGTNGNTKNSINIDSEDDFKSRNAKTPVEFRHKNHFTGAVKIAERGVWNSEPKRHTVEAEGYSVRRIVKNKRATGVGGFKHNKAVSRVTLASSAHFKTASDFLLATRGASDDTPFYNYGFRFRLLAQNGRTHQRAGFVIHNNGTKEDGYYFEFIPTRMFSAAGRAKHQEILLYTRVNGVNKVIGTAPAAIVENLDYEVDISFANVSGNHVISVWLNGKKVLTSSIGGANRNAANGKFGMVVRGNTLAEYEYIYAIAREEESPLLEDFSFLDRVQTGYVGNQWDREWVYRWKSYKRRVKKKSIKEQKRYNRQFFDEFGPFVHEIREYDVSFDPNPVLHSRLYSTNDWYGCIIEYRSTPFGAKFYIANTSRRNAVLNGEDTLSFSGTGDAINQVLTVLGRPLIIAEAQEVIAKNDVQIRRRGKNESEISSPWIQSKAMATDLANWLNNKFSYGNDMVNVEVFGNPLIELGDVVHVTYPDKYIDGDYFVVGTSSEFSNGLTTTLTLRRRN